MKLIWILSVLLLNLSLAMAEESKSRVLCHDRFEDEIWLMEGEISDDKTCKAMMIAGTVGLCFEGDAQEIADQMNDGVFEFSPYQKVNKGTAELISEDIIKYASYEGDFVPLTRPDNEIFRCPEFSKIKESTTQLADELESSVDYAVSRVYREKFGLPFWLKK